jgi:hypothetical protein
MYIVRFIVPYTIYMDVLGNGEYFGIKVSPTVVHVI